MAGLINRCQPLPTVSYLASLQKRSRNRFDRNSFFETQFCRSGMEYEIRNVSTDTCK